MSRQAAKGAVVLTGATGYVGSHLVSLLGAHSWDIRCIVRLSASKQDVDFLRSCGARIYSGDLVPTDPAVSPAFQGADTAIHLIGSISPRKGESPDSLHVQQTKELIGQCLINKVPRIILVTALGTAEDAQNGYHASKWMAEHSLRAVAVKHVIVRPSLIVGRQVGSRDSKLIRRYIDLIKTKPEVPLIAGGENKIQPLFIGDLARALERLLADDFMDGKTIEVGGPDIVTMRKLVCDLMQILGISKPVKVIPPALAKLVAFGCQLVQTVPMVSTDQVTLATMDNICRENRLGVLLESPLTPLTEALRTYQTI